LLFFTTSWRWTAATGTCAPAHSPEVAAASAPPVAATWPAGPTGKTSCTGHPRARMPSRANWSGRWMRPTRRRDRSQVRQASGSISSRRCSTRSLWAGIPAWLSPACVSLRSMHPG